jgi:hypothetical protein
MSSFQNGGEYDFIRRKAAGYRSESTPKNWRTKGTQFWELQKGHNSKDGTALDKSHFAFCTFVGI